LKSVDKFYLNFLIPYTAISIKIQIDFWCFPVDCRERAIHYRESGFFSWLPGSANKILYKIVYFIYSVQL